MSHPYKPQASIVPSPYHQSFWAGLGNYTRGSFDPTYDAAPPVDEALAGDLSSECAKLKAEALQGIRAGIASVSPSAMLTTMAMGVITDNFTTLAQKAITAGPEAAVAWLLSKIPGGSAFSSMKSMVVPLINAQMSKLKQCFNVKMGDGTGFSDPLAAARRMMQEKLAEQQQQQQQQHIVNPALIKAIAPTFVTPSMHVVSVTPGAARPRAPLRAPKPAAPPRNNTMLYAGIGAAAIAAALFLL